VSAALAIFREVLAVLEPRRLAHAAAARAARGPVELWAIGKAAAAMAAGVRDALPVVQSIVVAKDGPGASHAGHPIPDARSLAAGEALLARARALPEEATVVLALSGGASALAVAPAEGLTLDEKIATTAAVARSGAGITELNCVRKHLSRIKGGRLAAATPARLCALILSDVVGDDPSVIGSGPACADPTTFAEALAIARAAGAPGLALLEAGARGEREETPKPGDPRLARVEIEVLAGPRDLARAAAEAAGRRGLTARVAPPFTGTVEELAGELARCAREQPAGHATVIAGEPVVRLSDGAGRGGRAQHTALLVTSVLSEAHEPSHPPPGRRRGESAEVLCVASDGSDGPTADAGALVSAETVAWARAHPGRVAAALAGFDAGNALEAARALITTGPTGTNLCDLYLVVT